MSGKSTNSRFFYGHVVTAAGFGVWLICWGTFNPCFGVFLKPLLAEFGWTRAETALAYSLALSVQAVLTIMMGWLTDRLGPRTVVTVFGSFLGICYVLMSGVSTIWQFQLNYGLVGAVGLSALNIPIMVTIARWFVKRRGLIIGIVQAGLGIGGLIFPPFTAWLILYYGWRFAYMILGLITLVSCQDFSSGATQGIWGRSRMEQAVGWNRSRSGRLRPRGFPFVRQCALVISG